MKKLSILLLSALALTVTSCQDEKSKAEPTVNPQLPMLTVEDLQGSTAVAQAVDLTALLEADDSVVMAKVDKLVNLPEDYSIKYVATLAREESYDHVADLELTMTADSMLVASPDDFEGAYIKAMGKSAKPKTIYFRVAAYGVNGDAQVRIGDPDYYVCEGSTVVTPYDLGIVIEDGYGLLGTINGWSVANAVPMHNSGVSGYDDPIFKLIVSVSIAEAEAGWWWKVVPQSTIAAGDWLETANSSFGPAVNGDDSLEGNLVPRTPEQDSQAGCIKTAGIYEFTIDMENQTYEFVPIYDFLYVCGDPSWSHATAPRLLGSIGGTVFQGFAELSGWYKPTSQPNWNGTNYGAGADAGQLSTSAAAGNLKVNAKGMYFLKADTEKLTYTCDLITSCGLIGDFNGWGAQQALTTTDGGKTWTGSLTVLDGQGWKVRFNDNWDINLGGDMNNLTVGGDNITVPAGTYDVTLNLGTVPYTITLK